MKSKFLLYFLIIGTGIFMQSCTSGNSKGNTNNYNLVWSDEFDYMGYPDSTKWEYSVGDGCPSLCGWGNEELQYYTRKSLNNARVNNGHLIIEVHSEKIANRDYSSAKLHTKGKQEWQYGRYEIRARLPQYKGIWSAIWMLPTSNEKYGQWPNSGEIDIMENVGYDPTNIVASTHTGAYNFSLGTQKNNKVEILDNSEEFHTYALEWDEVSITMFVDDQEYFSLENNNSGYKEWPFDQPMYLILNVAYGGIWGGQQGIDADQLPQKMEIDFVRVYQRK